MSCSRTGISICARNGQLAHGRLVVGDRDVEPLGHGAVERVDVVTNDDHLLRLVAELEDVALAHRVRRDRHPAAVDRHVAVPHELAGLVATRREPGAEHDVVDAALEHPEQVLAGDALLAGGLGVEVAELLLEQAVDAARLLLLAQLEQVLALADPTATVLTRRIRTPLDRAADRVALRALQEELHPLAPAEPTDGTGVSRHVPLDPSPLRWAATVVRNRGDVLDAHDLDACVLE